MDMDAAASREQQQSEDEQSHHRNKPIDVYNKGLGMHGSELSEHLLKQDLELMDDGHVHLPSQFDIDMELVQGHPNLEFDVGQDLDVRLRFELESLDETHMLLGGNGSKENHWTLDFIGKEQTPLFHATSQERACLLPSESKQKDLKFHENYETWYQPSSLKDDNIGFVSAEDITNTTDDTLPVRTKKLIETSEVLKARQLSNNHLTEEEEISWFDFSEHIYRISSNERGVDASLQGGIGISELNPNLEGNQSQGMRKSMQIDSEIKMNSCDALLQMDRITHTHADKTMPTDRASSPSGTILHSSEEFILGDVQNIQTSFQEIHMTSREKEEFLQVYCDKDTLEQAFSIEQDEKTNPNTLTLTEGFGSLPSQFALSSGFLLDKELKDFDKETHNFNKCGVNLIKELHDCGVEVINRTVGLRDMDIRCSTSSLSTMVGSESSHTQKLHAEVEVNTESSGTMKLTTYEDSMGKTTTGDNALAASIEAKDNCDQYVPIEGSICNKQTEQHFPDACNINCSSALILDFVTNPSDTVKKEASSETGEDSHSDQLTSLSVKDKLVEGSVFICSKVAGVENGAVCGDSKESFHVPCSVQKAGSSFQQVAEDKDQTASEVGSRCVTTSNIEVSYGVIDVNCGECSVDTNLLSDEDKSLCTYVPEITNSQTDYPGKEAVGNIEGSLQVADDRDQIACEVGSQCATSINTEVSYGVTDINCGERSVVTNLLSDEDKSLCMYLPERSNSQTDYPGKEAVENVEESLTVVITDALDSYVITNIRKSHKEVFSPDKTAITERNQLPQSNVDCSEAIPASPSGDLHEVNLITKLGGASSEAAPTVNSKPLGTEHSDIFEAETLTGNTEHQSDGENTPGSCNLSIAAVLRSNDEPERKLDEARVAKRSNETFLTPMQKDYHLHMQNPSTSLLTVDATSKLCITGSGRQPNCETVSTLQACKDVRHTVPVNDKVNETFHTNDNSTAVNNEDINEMSQQKNDLNKGTGFNKGNDSCPIQHGSLLSKEMSPASFQVSKEEKEPVRYDGYFAKTHGDGIESERDRGLTVLDHGNKGGDDVLISSVLASTMMSHENKAGDIDNNEDDRKEVNWSYTKDVDKVDACSDDHHNAIYQIEGEISSLTVSSIVPLPPREAAEVSTLNGENETSIPCSVNFDNPEEVQNVCQRDISDTFSCKARDIDNNKDDRKEFDCSYTKDVDKLDAYSDNHHNAINKIEGKKNNLMVSSIVPVPPREAAEVSTLNGESETSIPCSVTFDNLEEVQNVCQRDISDTFNCKDGEEVPNRVELTACQQTEDAVVETLKLIATSAAVMQMHGKQNREVNLEARKDVENKTVSSESVFNHLEHNEAQAVEDLLVLAKDAEKTRLTGLNQALELIVHKDKSNNAVSADLLTTNCKDKTVEDASSDDGKFELENTVLAENVNEQGDETGLLQPAEIGSQSEVVLGGGDLMIKDAMQKEISSQKLAPIVNTSVVTVNCRPVEESVVRAHKKSLVDIDLQKSILYTGISCAADQNRSVVQSDFRKHSICLTSHPPDFQAAKSVLDGGPGEGPQENNSKQLLDCAGAGSLANNGSERTPVIAEDGISLRNDTEKNRKCLLPVSVALGTVGVVGGPCVLDKISLSFSVLEDNSQDRMDGAVQLLQSTVDSSRIMDGASRRSQLADLCEQPTTTNLDVAQATAFVCATQPFTNLQQVQLRAQILVYGSLIQGDVPDEALMAPAFKDLNGEGRQDIGWKTIGGDTFSWEKILHAAADRVKGGNFLNAPKGASQSATEDARCLSVSTARLLEVSAPESHVYGTIQNSVFIKSARLGTSSAPYHNHPPQSNFLSPARDLQLPYDEAMQNPAGGRLAQLDSIKLPHMRILPNSQVTPFITGTSHLISPSRFVGTERLRPLQGTVHAASTSSSSLQPFQGCEVAEGLSNSWRSASLQFPHMPIPKVGPALNFSGINDVAALHNSSSESSRLTSLGHRPPKRKKVQLEALAAPSVPATCTINLLRAPLTVSPASLPMVAATSHAPKPVVQVPFVATSTIGVSGMLPTSLSTLNSLVSQYQLTSDREHERRSVMSESCIDDLVQAKLVAEEATSFADSAVKQCESLWNHLQTQKDSGIISDKDVKLASSAVAITAATSVAKAAAAASRVAYEAALQAKVMGEEALGLTERTEDELVLAHRACGIDQTGKESTFGTQWMPRNFISTITKARETAKKRLEAAYAAKIRAFNAESIVKAAELATRAVSHVGTVVAMGDHFPFTLDMVLDVGPQGLRSLANIDRSGYVVQKAKTKARRASVRKLGRFKSKESEQLKQLTEKGTNLAECFEQPCQISESGAVGRPELSDNDKELEMEKSNNIKTVKECIDREIVAMQATAGPYEGTLSDRTQTNHHDSLISFPNSFEITKGSTVEVALDEEGLRGVWFSATVLKVKNGKAHLVYDELLYENGDTPLKEWIELANPCREAPRLRLAHPMIRINKLEGTRKRRRAAMGNHTWSVGDHVDAWIRDGWWEGEVLEKNEDDDTKIKVYFPGEGDTLSIRSWNLRPSLVWKDGHWVLWKDINMEVHTKHVEVSDLEDEPRVSKRQKVDRSSTVESPTGKGLTVDKELNSVVKRVKDKGIDIRVEESEDAQNLNAVVAPSVGTSQLGEITESRRDGMTGKDLKGNQSIEDSKVVFGVPKPTKKRKYIEVNMHCNRNRSLPKANISYKCNRTDRYKAPPPKNEMDSGISTKDADDKITKKSHAIVSKDGKGNKSKSTQAKSASGLGVCSRKEASLDGQMTSTSHLAKNNGAKSGDESSLADGKEPDVQRSKLLHTTSTSKQSSMLKETFLSRSVTLSTNVDVMKNKHPVISTKEDEKDKAAPRSSAEVLELRRSSRTIQPTLKLLEGLQSTSMLGKIYSSL